MNDFFEHVIPNFLHRWNGPLAFRLLMQPVAALVLAIRAGQRDARRGASPFLEAVFNEPSRRRALLISLWEDVARVFFLAVAMDLVFQWLFYGRVVIVQALVLGFVLAILPYILLRGPMSRFSKRRRARIIARQVKAAQAQDTQSRRAG